MNNISEEKNPPSQEASEGSDEKKKEETKKIVKSMNVDGVELLLRGILDDKQNIKNEEVDIKRMLTDLNKGIIELRAQINILKAMGFRGKMGTGSTVRGKNE